MRGYLYLAAMLYVIVGNLWALAWHLKATSGDFIDCSSFDAIVQGVGGWALGFAARFIGWPYFAWRRSL